eukprot:6197973-Pleurochrysis_carterae.AAC.2
MAARVNDSLRVHSLTLAASTAQHRARKAKSVQAPSSLAYGRQSSQRRDPRARLCFACANCDAYLRGIAAKVANNELGIEQYIITKQLTKAPQDYPDAKNQPHVQVPSQIGMSGPIPRAQKLARVRLSRLRQTQPRQARSSHDEEIR